MKNLCKFGAAILVVLLSASACDGTDDKYPKEYVGFDKAIETYTFKKNADEQDISIKIIAAKKSEKDREMTFIGKGKPGTQAVFKMLDTKATIPAKKKSATVRVRIYPKLIDKNEEIRIICSPNDKDVKQSQLTLKLVVK